MLAVQRKSHAQFPQSSPRLLRRLACDTALKQYRPLPPRLMNRSRTAPARFPRSSDSATASPLFRCALSFPHLRADDAPATEGRSRLQCLYESSKVKFFQGIYTFRHPPASSPHSHPPTPRPHAMRRVFWPRRCALHAMRPPFLPARISRHAFLPFFLGYCEERNITEEPRL